MADINNIREGNVAGEIFVDNTCIDCDVCRWMAPAIFQRDNQASIVFRQPESDFDRNKALQAMYACPTDSIGTTTGEGLSEAEESIPILLDDNVYQTCFHAPLSYGATPYLIKRDEGNVLVDSPRFDERLVKKLEEMGGVKYLYLTHKDTLADQQKFADHFKCERILHTGDISEDLASSIEIKIDGNEEFKLADDLIIIPQPGHTKGCTALLYKEKFLFTGDHLAFSATYNQIIGFQDYCWYSWETQIKSVRKLLNYKFEWLLPGHGRKFKAEAGLMNKEIKKCLNWMTATSSSV